MAVVLWLSTIWPDDQVGLVTYMYSRYIPRGPGSPYRHIAILYSFSLIQVKVGYLGKAMQTIKSLKDSKERCSLL